MFKPDLTWKLQKNIPTDNYFIIFVSGLSLQTLINLESYD